MLTSRLLVSGNLDDASGDQLVNEAVGCSLCELEDVYHFLDGGFTLSSEVRIQSGKLWLLQHVSNREKVANDMASSVRARGWVQ